MDLARSRWTAARTALALMAVAAVSASACAVSTGPHKRPTNAHIVVEGTAPVPLELVISTDFTESVDPITFQIVQHFNSADTFDIQLPHDHTVDLSALGDIVVRLKNPVVDVASVRLRISLDNGQAYDQSATLSDGAELVYVYVYGGTTPSYRGPPRSDRNSRSANVTTSGAPTTRKA